MYNLKAIKTNPGKPCIVNEVGFHPEGNIFAVTYGSPNDEVHIFDASTFKTKHVLKNPNAELNNPHGLLLTKNHMIVSNILDRTVASTINVYRLDTLTEGPVYVMKPSFKHLTEVHSIDIYNDIVAVTFCESATKLGAVVTYHFDDKTGELSEPIDIQEECFVGLGDSKGISFNSDGSQLYVTFESSLEYSFLDKKRIKLFRFKNKISENGLIGYMRLKKEKRKNNLTQKTNKKVLQNQKHVNLKNGLVVLDIDKNGKMSSSPSRVITRKEFCRYENVKLYGETLLITDTINNKVLFYNIESDPNLEHPTEVVKDSMTMPHGVKLSPDQSVMVVSNFGLSKVGKHIMWGHWTKKRGDNVLIYKRS